MARRKSQKRRNKKYQVSNRQLKAKRPYKDTIFRMLYHDKENLLSLYNAVNGRNYTNVEDLQIVTLENAIYMGMKNDLAFIMDMNLYLYEHQSTYNPNIPLRNLFYIADEYQRLVVRKSLYSTVIQKIPTPRFIVFYNGTKKVDDYNEFRLSSAYENPTDDPDLELKVTMLNVNDGHNLELMEHCRTLKEYAKYVARVRKYVTQNIPLEEAVTRAVDECIEEGILAEFLMKNKAVKHIKICLCTVPLRTEYAVIIICDIHAFNTTVQAFYTMSQLAVLINLRIIFKRSFHNTFCIRQFCGNGILS